MYVVLLVAAAFLFAGGGLFMKYSDGLTRLWPSAAVFVLFCLGAACQTLAMKRAEMGVVYIFVLGLEAVTAFVLSALILGESTTPAKVCAMLLIVGGIALLERA